jgi:hypothetical protein
MKLKNRKYGAQCRAGFRPEASACWPSPAIEAAYVAHAAGTVGAPPTGHRTRRTWGGAAAGGDSSDKVSLGWRYEHERRTTNSPNTEKTVKSHQG